MSVATLRYTSDAASTARREAAQARREAAAQRAFARTLAMVRVEGDCFGVKVRSTDADWRASGWTAEMVARLLCDPETDVEYWPVSEL